MKTVSSIPIDCNNNKKKKKNQQVTTKLINRLKMLATQDQSTCNRNLCLLHFPSFIFLCLSNSFLKLENERDLVSAELQKAWKMEISVELNNLKVVFYELRRKQFEVFSPLYSPVT